LRLPLSSVRVDGYASVSTVADVAGMIVKNWVTDIEVRFSGIVRPGDPFSLLADDAGLRRLPFEWRIPIDRGLADYVKWFKDRLH
jgi:UDP-glucose 4-epimerase